MSLFAYIRMVLWSLLGIRRRAAFGEEVGNARPLVLLATALVLVGTLVAGLLAIAMAVAGQVP